MRKDDARALGFAAVICAACSLVLSVAAASLRQRQEANVELDRRINVLKAFGVPVADAGGRRIAAAEVDRIFAAHIAELILDAETGAVAEGLTGAAAPAEDLKAKRLLPLYQWREEGTVTKYAFPISGPGLWSTIHGYLALDRDLATIVGVTFYRHGETPGLGAEIDRDAFQDQWKGKRVWADGALLPFEVVKGPAESKYPGGNDHAVDGITGATLTGRGITRFLNADLERYEPYFRTQRRA